MEIKNKTKGILNFFLALFFPERCLSCKRADTSLCPDCLKKLSPAEETPARYLHVCFSYKDPRVAKAIHLLKFRGRASLAEALAVPLSDLALSIAEETLMTPSLIVLVPVPSNTKRVRDRGFDQASLLASLVAEISGFHRVHALTRVKNARPQTELSRRERLENMRGVFAIVPNQMTFLRGKTVILIDDVMTTGATMREARKVLLESGVRSVHGITLAH